MAETQRELGYGYNVGICSDDHLRSLEVHILDQIDEANRFLEAVQAEMAQREQMVHDACCPESA
jgi:hypothetical protein